MEGLPIAATLRCSASVTLSHDPVLEINNGAGRYLLFGLQGSRQQKLLVLRFFDIKKQQGIDRVSWYDRYLERFILRVISIKQRDKRMASMNTRLNIEKLNRNIVKKHGGSKQVGFKQLGPGVETGVHEVDDEKHVWFEVELQGAQGDREVKVSRGYNQFTYLVNGLPSSAIGFKNPIDMLAVFGWLASIKHGMLEPVKEYGFEVKPLGDHTFKVKPQKNIDQGADLQEVQTQILMEYQLARDKDQHLACELFEYREDSNEVAFAFASVEKIYVHESLTFDNTVACKVEIRVSLLVKAKGNILGLKIIRDQSEGHSILSLEGTLSGDCDVQKNDKHTGFLDFNYAMGRSITIISRSITGYGLILECVGSLKAYLQHMKAWKKEIWLKRLLTESGCELRLVAGIATGTLVKGCSRFEVPAQVKVVAYRY
nr:zinc finger, CCHC-type [Tanacetum cinerariifolium]